MRGGVQLQLADDPAAYVGRRVWKRFCDGFYAGVVQSTCDVPGAGRVWRVHYPADDDCEDVRWAELSRILLPVAGTGGHAAGARGGPVPQRGGHGGVRAATPSGREDAACAQPAALKQEHPTAAAAAGSPAGAAVTGGKRKRVAPSASPSASPTAAQGTPDAEHGSSPAAASHPASCHWSAERVAAVADACVASLRTGSGWQTRTAVRLAARSSTRNTALLDFVLKSLQDTPPLADGLRVVRRMNNATHNTEARAALPGALWHGVC
jgi:hypothetical protein